MDSSKVIVTGVFEKDYKAPQTMDVGGQTLTLQEQALAVGLDEKNNVYFQGVSSGMIRIVPVSEKALNHILDSAKQCSVENCKNRSLKTKKCWEHS